MPLPARLNLKKKKEGKGRKGKERNKM